MDVIRNTWQSKSSTSSEQHFINNVRHCRVGLLKWKKESFANISHRLQEKRECLAKLYCGIITDERREELRDIHHQIHRLLEAEETMWKQRTKNLWLVEGDRNTKYFHAQANNRRQRNMIKGLLDKDGQWTTEKQKIENLAVDYFQNIFSSDVPSSQSIN